MRNASTNKIATTGEIFQNGNILEVLFDNRNRRLSLGLWNGEELKIGPRFEYRGHVYEPASIDSERLRALRFPMNISSPESTPKLLEEVATIVQCYSGLPPTYATLTAYFVLATWVVDVIPTAPWFSFLCMETMASAQLPCILDCLCRRSLSLTEVTPASLSSLPWKWQPTLLLRQAKLTAAMQRILSATRRRSIHIPQGNRLLDMSAAVATFTELGDIRLRRSPLCIEVPVGIPRLEPKILGESEAQKIAEYFQPKLLSYRLMSHTKVSNSGFDAQSFTFPVREIARSLGSCTPGNGELQEKLLRLLTPQDAEILSERWVDPTTVVIDSLLAACHQAEKTQMYVGEIAQDVEVILGGRGDYRKIEAREVGHRIKQLGLVTEARNSKGFRLVLTQPVRRRVHELARSLAVPTIQNSVVRCEDCQGKAR